MSFTREPRRHGKPEQKEQEDVKKLLHALGAKFWVAGTKRKRTDYQGTMMTPGLPDIPFVFLPRRGARAGYSQVTLYDLVVIEMKSPQAHQKRDGGLSVEQAEFKRFCDLAGITYVHGDAKAIVQWLVEQCYLRADQVATHWMD